MQQPSTTNENGFKFPLLTVPSVPAIKRKLSRTEPNIANHKVHLRRQSNSFSDSIRYNNDGGVHDTLATAPLSDRTLSSVNHDINTADLPVLVLAPFEQSPWLEFGKVIVGAKKTVTLAVHNPTDSIMRLYLDPNCKMEEKGFNISQLDPLQSGIKNGAVEPLVLQPRSKTEINVCWIPLSGGTIRASAVLKTNNGRFMVNLRGCGEIPIPEYQSLNSSRRQLTASVRNIKQGTNGTSNQKSNVLKQSVMRHSVIRTDSSNIPPAPGGYSTLPYVTTNDMYDEKWIDKQERSFSQWLNHEFNVTVDSFSAKDPSSWSYYSHKLEFEHTRASACKIYQSDAFRIVLRKVEDSIGRDRLQLRPDINLVGDIGTRREIMDLLFSFDIRWLVLGLETITGKATAINPNFDRATISGFINKAIFHDSQIEAEFEPDRILSNRARFHQVMNRLVLKRIFMLILFLDKAKIARLIPSDPCLFNKDSDIKSCRVPLDEFDYTVKNLAVDLRDGVRLCRLIDLHCPELNLCQSMKFPTLSKAHMQQNVSLALNALVKQGIALEGIRGGLVSPRDIVEGHREKTFGLLWKLILNWKVSVLLDLNVLEAEIAAIMAEYKRMFGVDQPDRVGLHQPEPQLPESFDGKGWFISTKDIKDPITQAKEMDRFNYRLLHNKVQALGGVPITLRHADMSNIGVPDEKAVILFVTYLCARIMHLNKDIRAAKTIQRIWRKKHYGRNESNRINATIVIQRFIRKFLSQKHTRSLRQQQHEAALLIQTGCRMYLAQAQAIRKLESVILIQTHCRGFLARKHYVEIQWAALTMQRYFRGHVVRKHSSVILQAHRAAQMIQAQSRGYLVRKQFLLLRLAAEVIQSRRRALVEVRRVRGLYLSLVSASIVIQRYWRATVSARKIRQAYLQQRDWTIKLQSHIRSILMRKAFIERRSAAIVIQRRLRERNMTRELQHELQMKRWAASVIQSRWRATVASRYVQYEYQMLRYAAIKIQSIARGNMVRRQYSKLQVAALIIQRRRRALDDGRIQRFRFLQLRTAALVIQERRRAVLLGRATRVEYNKLRSILIRMQASARGYLLRQRLIQVTRENDACMIIQAAWRGYIQRRAYIQVREATIKIQQTWRAVQLRRLEQHAFKEHQWGAVVIQRWWRACKVGQDIRNKYYRLRQAAIVFQSVYRGRVARQEAQTLRAIVGVQSIVRMRIERWRFEMLRVASIIIQRRWRARQSGIEQRAMYNSLCHASIIIQRKWRALTEGRRVRYAYQSMRILTIATQAHVRGAIVRAAYHELRQASIIVQRRWRALNEGRAQRQAYLEQWTAARKIQAAWRSTRLTKMQRHAYLNLQWGSVVIQRRWRHILNTRAIRIKEDEERQAAAILIQTAVRGILVRNQVRRHLEDRERVMVRWIELSSLSLASIIIQRCWRRFRDRKMEELHETAATIIQRWWRHHLEVQQVNQLNMLVFMMQTQIRGVLARQMFHRQQHAIVKLQAWWRGHLVRQDCTAKIKAARKRIEHANATAEEHMKLGNRTTMALDILLSSGQLSAVLKACYHLDVVTRLSKNSCLRLVEHNVVNIIFQLIKSCNRSQPHMEVLKHGLNIIENLSRDPDTVGSVFWAPEGMEIIVDCAQAYRENEMVFESVVTILLIHLEHDDNRRRVMRAMGPEVKKLNGVLAIMQRKVERETRSKSLYMTPGKPVRLLISSVGKLRKIVELLQ
ncbi:hypothetical protein BGZ49_001118 [Haplosporangium sp. Z 27]|nr:hypothetical protein BGZ49_001118 [Haplosporangium sp. Z 27]